MGVGSIWHWVVLLIAVALFCIPLARILNRTGHSGWWALLYFVPVANLIGLWVWAYKKWTIDER